MLGLLSLSLALLNLLPLLPLDGGHIAFSIIEGVRGRAVGREVYERVSAVGIALVLLLFFIGLSNDIGNLRQLMASERSIRVGNVEIGGGAPVVIQSMTLTPTHDVPATTAQIAALASAGCEVVRCAVPKIEDAEALRKIVRLSPIPVIADIHFNASLALRAIDAGVAAVRINPGNIGGPDKVEQVVEAARAARESRCGSARTPARCRSTCTSSRTSDQAEALVAAALEEVELLESLDFHDFKISVKSTHVPTMIRAYRLLSERVPYPLHLGVTEAGTVVRGLDQERDRHRRAARGRDRRHAARLAHGRPREGGRGRLGDPEGARPPRARADHDRLPVLRARQRRRREPRRRGREAG